jgi:hypothetical protein
VGSAGHVNSAGQGTRECSRGGERRIGQGLETRFAVLCALKYFDGYRLPDFMVAERAWETLASSF